MKIRLAGVVVLVWFIQVAAAATRYVDASPHTPVSPYTSWAAAATNIQDALNVAGYGETILVNDGVYKFGGFNGVGNHVAVNARIYSFGKYPTIQSVNGPEVTIIKGQSGDVCAHLTSGTVLSGFTLMNSTNYISGYSGGVYCETADCIVTNCIISGNYGSGSGGVMGGMAIGCLLTNNTGGSGGGACSNTLINCTLVSNQGGIGGGAYRSYLTNCLLAANVSKSYDYGGGAAAYSVLNSCVVSNNTSISTGGTGGNGGGLYRCTANDSLISSNRTVGGDGGGAYSSVLSNCIVQNNFSVYYGGGAYGGSLTNCLIVNNTTASFGQGGGAANAEVNNCLITGNAATYGAGLANCVGNNCTIVGNLAISSGYGAGSYYGQLNNSIICYNQAVTNADTYRSALTNCCTSSLAYPSIANSFTNEPSFVDPNGDFHLQSDSPCINAGNNSFTTDTNDLDGNPRIVGGTVDVGAYEYQWPASVISYAWLQQYGLPTDSSADYTDDDGDGMTNWQEWLAGTNPTNPASFLQMYSATPTNDASGVTVSWQSVSGKMYLLQRSADLSVFSTIQSNITGQADVTSYKDTIATGSGPFFYRVGVQ